LPAAPVGLTVLDVDNSVADRVVAHTVTQHNATLLLKNGVI